MEPTKCSRLKKLRLEKGISLEEIQKKTKIHPNILRAIEGDAITDLSPVYLKSFLKIYCKFLGVDYREYLGDYKESGASDRIIEELRIKRAPQPIPESKSFLREAGVKINSLRPNKKISRAIIIVVAGIFLLAGLVKAGKALFSKSGRSKVTSASTEAATTKVKKAAPKKNDASSEIRLGIRAKD
ncbi:MAG: helix-turn-helix domain-containing protein, partial [Candidatus Omnitrophota bacterium]|nr:helix-turn-helix domain-containing protein [Candidatus Omnitrophota bacterium]